MYNSFLHNTTTYNALPTTDASSETTDPIFNDFTLNEGSVSVPELIASQFSYDNGPLRRISTSAVPRRAGSIILSDYWREKTFRVSGVIDAETKEALDSKIREMKNALAKQDGILEWTDNGERLQAVANWVNPQSSFDRDDAWQLTFCEYSLVFEAYNPPFAQKKTYSAEDWFDQTILSFSESVTTDGNAPMYPVVIMSFSAASSVTKVKFENTTTEEAIQTETISVSAGDKIKFDSERRKVYHDSGAGYVEIDYDGFFPELKNGENTFTITTTGTSATYSVTVKYKESYL
jgi:phage-related protein